MILAHLLAHLWLCLNFAVAEQERIAIIGAGIAGSAVSWFIKDEHVNVTLFERARIGGRVQELEFPKKQPITVEAGGAAIHSLNHYMAHFINELHLHRDTSSPSLTSSFSTDVATWDGTKLIPFNPAAYPLSLLQLRRMVSNVTSQWEHIYDLQARNISFSNPYQMLEALGVANLARTKAHDWMSKLDPQLVRDFVDGVSRVNYGQDSSINAFADSVSLAGAGLVGSLYSVLEGNSKVMEGLVRKSGAKLRNATVLSIRASASGYEVCTQLLGCDTFGSVIIAAPLELADVKLDADMEQCAPLRQYHVTVATFVTASGLNPRYFGAAHEVKDNTIMTTANQSIPFASVAVHGFSAGRQVYKVFSPAVLNSTFLRNLFINASDDREQIVWRAYPELQPSEHWPEFRLHSSTSGAVYYVNAMESPVSCMESEAVGAKNVALLYLADKRRREQGLPPNQVDCRAGMGDVKQERVHLVV